MEFILIIGLVITIAWMVNQVSSGNAFRDNCVKIVPGMHTRDVLNIMGKPSYNKFHPDGCYELVYEKSEWKGFFRGGTITRRMEVVCSPDDIVISVGRNDNCHLSGW